MSRPLADPLVDKPALLGGTPAFAQPLYYTRPRVPAVDAFHARLDEIFAARWFTNDGLMVKRLEAALTLRLGVGFCAAFCNGTVALQTALKALDLSGEVITTPFTFPATVHAIEWLGLTPVFCDIDAKTYNLDPAAVAASVTSSTSAVLPVHVFGNPCDVVAFESLSERTGLKIVYDAAHAFGVSIDGRSVADWGDLTVLSFHATKLFHTAEGGAIVGAAGGSRGRIARLRNFGILGEEEVSGTGTNGKMSELHAALGLTLLDHLDEELSARARLSALYATALRSIEGLSCQHLLPGATPNHAYCTIVVDADRFGMSRDQLHVALRAENIVCRKYFFPLCSDNPAYRQLPSADPARLPNALRLSSRILSLPLFGDLPTEDAQRVVDAIARIHAHARLVRSIVTHG